MDTNELIFQTVHKIGNSLFALQTTFESLKFRLGENQPPKVQEVMQAMEEIIESMNSRIIDIKNLETSNDSDNIETASFKKQFLKLAGKLDSIQYYREADLVEHLIYLI